MIQIIHVVLSVNSAAERNVRQRFSGSGPICSVSQSFNRNTRNLHGQVSQCYGDRRTVLNMISSGFAFGPKSVVSKKAQAFNSPDIFEKAGKSIAGSVAKAISKH